MRPEAKPFYFVNVWTDGGVVYWPVRCNSDRDIAGSTPGRSTIMQRLGASCSYTSTSVNKRYYSVLAEGW